MQLDQEFNKNHTEKVKFNTNGGHVNVNNLVNKGMIRSNVVKDFKKFENDNGSIKEETIEEDDEELMSNTHSRLIKKNVIIMSPPMINSVRNLNMP